MRTEKTNAQPEKAIALMEVMVAVALFGLMFVGLYSGISAGFEILSLSRENVRATQVVLEKLETIRMYSWDQVNSNGFIPANFTATFSPGKQIHGGSTGTLYYGKTQINNASVNPAYDSSMRELIISVVWTNGNIRREREMRTYISEYGTQRYIID